MTPDELATLFRADVVDNVEPYLWSDEEVAAFTRTAQEMFVRFTGGIQDATSTLCALAITEDEKWVAHDPRILRIVSATLRSTGYPVEVLNAPNLTEAGKQWSPSSINLPGPVCAIVLGMDDANIRVVQVPTADDTVDLVIERLPLEAPEDSGEFEIAAHHHYFLLEAMRHLAYLKQDSETFDKVKSDTALMKFKNYCAEAFLEKERRKNKPRLMAYGGIGGATPSRNGQSSWRSTW